MKYQLTRSDWKRSMEPVGDPMGFGRLQDFIFGSDSPAPAAPAVQQVDPLVGQAMLKQSETGDRTSREAEARMREYDPLLKGAAQQQLDIGADNQKRSKAQWEDFNNLFRPAEKKYVDSAMGYDTPERRESEAQKAAADVDVSMGASNEQAMRDLSRAGIMSPNADILNGTRGVSLARGAVKAGAMNAARTRVEDTGAARVEGVAKFGRGLPSTGIAADQVALAGASGGSNTLMGANAAGIAAGNAGLAGWGAAAGTGIGIANANNSANMASYNGQVNAWGQQQNANATASAGFGQLLGTGLSVAQKAGWFSSKKLKEGMKPVNEDKILAGIRKLKVEQWRYKPMTVAAPTPAKQPNHIGPYAEDVKKALGEAVAPGGEYIDSASMAGVLIVGIKKLAERMDRMEAMERAEGHKIKKAGIRRKENA
ncbi:MAG: tail fiber domain-containing protein [Phycisphaerae bacterium]